MTPVPEEDRCTATSKQTGERCRNGAFAATGRCYAHEPLCAEMAAWLDGALPETTPGSFTYPLLKRNGSVVWVRRVQWDATAFDHDRAELDRTAR